MITNIVALDKNTHKNLKVKQDLTFKHASNQHLSLLQAHEFTAAALHYPIVFVKDSDTGQFISVVMLGLEPTENLFRANEEWSATYIPSSIRGYPFLIAPETMSLCIDTSCELLNDVDGENLFNSDGSESTYLKSVKELLTVFLSQTPETKGFINSLTEMNLLTNLTLTIQDKDRENGDYQLNGIYAVDSTKLHELSDSDFLTLKRKNYLPPIYAHLLSLGSVASLIQKKSSQQK